MEPKVKNRVDSGSEPKPWPKVFRALGLGLATALLVACGGSNEDTASPGGVAPAPEPAPPPAAQAFKLLPARLGLGTDDDGLLVALGSAGPVVWSSSDPSVASVDAVGHVKAISKGSAVISAASGADIATATLTVYRTSGANPDPSSETLIAQALAGGRITAEQALSYRVFALFGDPRLPAELDGAPSELADHLLMREVSGRLPTLSQTTQDMLRPFMIPPTYPESWFAQQARPTVAALSANVKKRADLTINCFFGQAQLGALRRSTAHFNVHTVFGDDLLRGDDDKPTAETVSEFIASVIEDVYQSETSLFKRFPLPDTNEPCNGGDGAVDVYVHPLVGRMKSITVAYPNRCEAVPAYIVVNSSELFLSFGIARSVPLATKKKEWKSYIAHEFAHVLQFGIDRSAGCDDYKWLDEATATWVMDHVDATANFEDGGERKSTPLFNRAGRFYANYLYNDHRVSIEKSLRESNPELNGYGDYIFMQYLARTYSPDTIKQIFDATETQGSVEAMASVLTSKGGMKAVWPEFAKTLWNDDVGKLFDDWSRLDRYDFGLAAIYSPTAMTAATVASTQLKALRVDQKGQPRATFVLLDNALDFPGEYYEVQPRSMFYEHLKFTDASVHSVLLVNPVAILPNRDFMKVQAVRKIAGKWQAAEDWTADPTKSLCLDKKDERVEELLIIVSNSEANRGVEEPFRIPKIFPMRLSTSNVGCWRWSGTASTEKTYDDGSLSGTFTGSGVVRWDLTAVLPLGLQFEPREGFVDGMGSARNAACTFVDVGERRKAGTGAFPDGRLHMNLDLEFGIGEPPDRNLTAFDGGASLQTTSTMTCPGSTVTRSGLASFTWLQVDSERVYAVSADGQTIEGQYIASFPLTRSSITTRFKFTAERE